MNPTSNALAGFDTRHVGGDKGSDGLEEVGDERVE